ncbi:MAG TPA: protein kinase, partial [Blastocatellia bacterium]|nr:protein kinase [Blastocatellia bacterium]
MFRRIEAELDDWSLRRYNVFFGKQRLDLGRCMKPEKWHRVQALFLAALARDVSERSDFLDEACSGDDTVRREVNSLLEMHETSDHLLKQDVGGMAAELLGSGDDALLSGQSFGDYQVERLIGEGGMGRVYLARDLRLGRPVALKLLPAYFTSDADRLRRFRIESRAASAINHPNIVTIYEVGREDQLHFIAAEYVEGRTLSERISEHPLPLADIVDISIQIADALDEAHRRGVIHRDIKSANIMVTDRGRVKVLDFGLAKLADSRREELDLELNGDTTAPGIVLGSVHYMSPEQALAGDVDLRTDIFSLGVVMYEMTTGRLPFRGATVAQVFVQIIHGQPQPITEYNKDRSLELERIIGKCLEKDRDQRYHSVSDLLIELRSLKAQLASGSDLTAGGKASAQGQGHGSFARTLAWRRPLVALGLIIVALFGYWLLARFHRRSELGPAPSQKFVPVIDWKQGPGELWSTEATFSPDGRMIAFSSVSNGKRGIWVKQVAGGEAVRVTSDRWFSVGPIWSPDGQSLAFVSDIDDHVAIWTASALGGSPTHLADVTADFPDSISLRHWS